jgi:AraC-like DNA-binding protein
VSVSNCIKMPAEEQLKLHLLRLRGSDHWAHHQEGLAFVFPKEGRGKYAVGRVTIPLGPGDVLVSNAGKEGRIVAADSKGTSFLSFCMQLEHLFPLFSAEEVSLLDAVAERLAQPKRLPASTPLAKQCHQIILGVPTEYNLEHRTQLLQLATRVLADEFEAARLQRMGGAPAKDKVSQVLSRLSAEELLRYSVEELAERLNCSRRHLSRLFQQRFGFSVAALRMELRMMKAVTLLRNPDAKVLIIAEQCGFNHLGLFNTCFKKRFGLTPTQWRQQKSSAVESSMQRIESLSLCPFRLTKACDDIGGSGAPATKTAQE